MRRTAVVCFAVIVVGRLAAADPTPISNEHACKLLKRAAVELCLAKKNLEGRLSCKPEPERAEHYVLALRYETTPDEKVDDNLIGWYAIRKSDGTILEWDSEENRPMAPVMSGCPFESE
jgi:hypothetical protein